MTKKFIYVALAVLATLSCTRSADDMLKNKGYLSLAGLEIKTDDQLDVDLTKAAVQAPGSYIVTIKDSDGIVVKNLSYLSIKENESKISLTEGAYTLEVSSTGEAVPASVFEQPVYGASTNFNITAGETTILPAITCRLLQCKVSVGYDAAFLESITGNGNATVEVTAGAPLNYALNYNSGNPTYEQSAGYFAINNGDNTTMTVSFKGSIDGKSQKMTTQPYTGIKAAQWRQIKFVKKVDEQGNATFEVVINGYIEDEEITASLSLEPEGVIGDDPDAPKGDGGMTLDFAPGCTQFNDLMNIVIPKSGTMDLRLVATIPGGVAKFTVNIGSDNASFIEAVNAAGGTTLDLVNPSEESGIIFQIVPFPHGSELLGATQVDFDLSAAAEPIAMFAGNHTFTMNITDNNGCKKQIPVKMIVEE